MTLLTKFAFLIIGFALAAAAHSETPAPREDAGAIRKIVEQFLHLQSAGLPGEVSIVVGAVDPRLYLVNCPSAEAFLPGGNKAWGKTTVGVRCADPARWTVYISATVGVAGDYIAAVANLTQGQVIGTHDVAVVHGDLTSLPPGIVTDLSQAVGLTAARSVPAGMPLRQDSLRSPLAVQQGQVVRLVSSGEGFRVSAEGHALTNAADGQIAQARTAGGQVVSGIARMGGTVEVNY